MSTQPTSEQVLTAALAPAGCGLMPDGSLYATSGNGLVRVVWTELGGGQSR